MLAFDGAMASQPMLWVPYCSKIGSKCVPPSMVFQMPPLAMST